MPLIEPQRQNLSTAGTSATGLATWPIEARMRGLALLVGAGLTGTVTFQGSIDSGQTWSSIAMTIGAGTLAATTTAAGLFTLMNPGLSHLRANCTTYSSGSCDCALGFST
jgi:hypothetical protein